MSRYEMLVRVLDGIRAEAIGTKFESLYASRSKISQEIWQARSRANVHLYLKVMFGITEFSDRETFVTDGGQDGGIDGYFIDTGSHTIFLIQSKFRNTEENFESKPIEIEEVLSMQIKRILGGEELDENGIRYNGKILGLQRKISEIPDLGRFSYKVIIIANLSKISDRQLLQMTDGIEAEIIDFKKSYSELLYPVISGTLFKASGLSISLDLSNKSAGAKIGYTVFTNNYECEITVVFVPTIEIAQIMTQYRNSILRYNPRSYLEFKGQKVNEAIRETILSSEVNEFALLNNGITIICDESGINEQSGRRHRAQLFLLNPQIINGGQTAYTLSRVYDELTPEKREEVFSGKEVLVKAIALTRSEDIIDHQSARVAFIERISMATNSQTAVTLADRTSGDPLHSQIQSALFDRFGLLYERKRGEFSDGIKDGYISAEDLISRAAFARVYLAAIGKLTAALKRKIAAEPLGEDVAKDPTRLDQFMFGLHVSKFFSSGKAITVKRRYMEALPRIFAATLVAQKLEGGCQDRARTAARRVREEWPAFLDFSASRNAGYVRTVVDRMTGKRKNEMKYDRKFLTAALEANLRRFFSDLSL